MICRLCNRDIKEKFYLHLNRSHKMRKEVYLEKFPEQREEYKSMKGEVWNKGLTKDSDSRVKQYADKIKKYTNKDCVRKERSDRIKKRYKDGDILLPEVRSRVQKSATEGWVKKIKSVIK